MAGKRIVLISLHTPTPENTNGASALPFHILTNRPDGWEIVIYTFNANRVGHDRISEISETIGCKIEVLKDNFKFRVLNGLFGKIAPQLRGLLPFPMARYRTLSVRETTRIDREADFIWIYGEELGVLAAKFPDKKVVVTTPDCEAMYYQRVLSLPTKLPSYSKIFRYGRAYWQYLNEIRHLPTKNTIYHLVGKEDADFLRKINPEAKTVFIPHPHYEGNETRIIKFSSKIKLLIPGRYDFYSAEAVDEAIESLIENRDLAQHYDITFQGKNWDKTAKKLIEAGYSVTVKGFVPSYKDELCHHDIQLSPIGVGTGTKGKVLDAFINGLLVIAPLRAIENIVVEDRKDYLFYTDGHELANLLRQIPSDIHGFEKMAESGRCAVKNHHSPAKISKRFFDLFD